MFVLRELDHEILLAIAWAAPLTTQQIHLLLAGDATYRTIVRALERMRAQGWLELTRVYGTGGGKGVPPKRRGWVWQLRPAGWRALPDDARKPAG